LQIYVGESLITIQDSYFD